nr:NADH dehydrogenase [ubiquinone] 1 alpha subcomplex subunit 2-like [Procambarus clarkii]
MATSSSIIKLAPHLRELRIHLCQRSPASQGVRDFIEKNYVALKKANPKFPILIREIVIVNLLKIIYSWANPLLIINFYLFTEMGQESSASLEGLSAQQVAEAIAKLNASK